LNTLCRQHGKDNMLKRIHIKGYKSLRDVEVRLSPLAVLFGPNAAGKSNFLDALQLLSKLATSKTLKEAFDPPYRGKPLESFSFGEEGIKGLLERERLSFSIEADLFLSNDVVDAVNRQVREMRRPNSEIAGEGASKNPAQVREHDLRYRIEVEMLPKSGILRVTDEYLAALDSKGELRKRKPFIERHGEKVHLRLEGQAHPRYYERYPGGCPERC
jgi:predicted ATPase